MTKYNTTIAEPTSRRSMLGMAAGLGAATIATAAVAVQSAKAEGKTDKLDAELLELGRQFDSLRCEQARLRFAFTKIAPEWTRILAEEEAEPRSGKWHGSQALHAAEARFPIHLELADKLNAVTEGMDALWERASTMQAQSLAGAAVLVRIVEWVVNDNGCFEVDEVGNTHDDFIADVFASLRNALERTQA